ncbi:MAG: enoyl-CoA hydratase/isomerase family protein [Hyphomicrobiales bacterium]
MSDLIIHEMGDDGIAMMGLNRAPVNALNPDFLSAIKRHIEELEANPSVRAVILTGNEKLLSAGMDLKELIGFSAEEERATVKGLNETFAALYGFSKPLITAANGHAIAGGLFFVFAGDYRLTVERATFGLTEVRVGVDFPVGPLEIARQEMAPNVRRLIFQRGKNVSSAQALEWGIVDEIVEPNAILARAHQLAMEYAAIPPKAYASVKAQVRGPALKIVQTANKLGSDPALKGWLTDETPVAAQRILTGS